MLDESDIEYLGPPSAPTGFKRPKQTARMSTGGHMARISPIPVISVRNIRLVNSSELQCVCVQNVYLDTCIVCSSNPLIRVIQKGFNISIFQGALNQRNYKMLINQRAGWRQKDKSEQ